MTKVNSLSGGKTSSYLAVNKLPSLKEVTLEHAKEIMKQDIINGLQIPYGGSVGFGNGNFFIYDKEECCESAIFLDIEMGIIAIRLGYYVPKLSEALKIKELEGELKALRYFAEELIAIFSGKNPYDLAHSVAFDIAALEKEISELKQGTDG